MSIDPITINNYKPKDTHFRYKEDREKMLGDALIRTKSFVTEKVRIQESIQHYKNLLDTEATANKKMVPEFRERDVSKEIQPKMRFTASTQLERIIDSIAQNRNSVENKKTKFKKQQTISEMVMDSVQKNLIQSQINHQNYKLGVRNGSQEPTRDSNGQDSNIKTLPKVQSLPLQTFYSTTSSSRLRIASSAFMTQNHFLAREINKNYKKLHFKATQSVQMQHPGTLKSPIHNAVQEQNSVSQAVSPNQTLRSFEMTSPFNKNSLGKTQESFLVRQQQLNSSKSAFYLPVSKSKMGQSHIQFHSHFQLPQVINPIQISKEKQKQMTSHLEFKSLNPYDQKRKKHQFDHNQDFLAEQRRKAETLMHNSQVESTFYNIYYKNQMTVNKKLRFANDQQEESNFGLDTGPLLSESENSSKVLSQKVKKQKNDKSLSKNNISQIESMASDILVKCNAVEDKNKQQEKMLLKGEGRTLAGSGKTNIEMYNEILKSF